MVSQSGSNKNLERIQDQFVHEWGRMSSSWGINRTMAQIHALLFVSSEPLDMNDVIERLHISRGNASMNLRELMDWGLVKRHRAPGDRKDTYFSETDPYEMFLRVVRERKRREIDPTGEAIKECISHLKEVPESADAELIRNRLQNLLEIFKLVNAAYELVFSSDTAFNELRQLLASSPTSLSPSESSDL